MMAVTAGGYKSRFGAHPLRQLTSEYTTIEVERAF
jgi:hypothetical protein